MSKKSFGIVILCFVMLMSALSLCSCGSNKMVLNNDTLSMTVGETYQLKVSNTNRDITWSSSNDKVATVDNGTVSAVSKGNATISAMTDNGDKLTCEVSVDSVAVTSIKFDKTNITLRKGDTDQITATVYPSEAEYELEWDSTDNSVAVVDNGGLVTAIGKGTAVIRCYTSSGKSASCSVTVKTNDSAAATQPTTNSATYNNNNNTDSILYCRASDYASLREYNSRDAKRIAKIYTRESVVYISETTEFYYVAYQGKRGYVLKDYFSYNPDAPLNYGKN